MLHVLSSSFARSRQRLFRISPRLSMRHFSDRTCKRVTAVCHRMDRTGAPRSCGRPLKTKTHKWARTSREWDSMIEAFGLSRVLRGLLPTNGSHLHLQAWASWGTQPVCSTQTAVYKHTYFESVCLGATASQS